MKDTFFKIAIVISSAILFACSNTIAGVGKDLQAMGQPSDSKSKPAESNSSQSGGSTAPGNSGNAVATPVK